MGVEGVEGVEGVGVGWLVDVGIMVMVMIWYGRILIGVKVNNG